MVELIRVRAGVGFVGGHWELVLQVFKGCSVVHERRRKFETQVEAERARAEFFVFMSNREARCSAAVGVAQVLGAN
jgi:hypothetical protein